MMMGKKGSGISGQGLVSEVKETTGKTQNKTARQKETANTTEQEKLSELHGRDKKDRRLNWRQACFLLHCGRTKFFDLIANGDLKYEGVGIRGHYVWESDCVKLLQSTAE